MISGNILSIMDRTYNKPIHSRSQIGNFIKKQNKLFRTCKRNQPLKKFILEGKVQCQRNRKTKDIVRMMWSHCDELDCGE